MKEWECTKVLDNTLRLGDSFKNRGYLLLSPGFNPSSYPYILCSSEHHINLINIKQLALEPVISADTRCTFGQPAFFCFSDPLVMQVHFNYAKQMRPYDTCQYLNWIYTYVDNDNLNRLVQLYDEDAELEA